MVEISENAAFEIEIDIVPSACVHKTNISFIDMSTSLKCSEMVRIFKCLDFIIIIIDDKSRFKHLKHTELKIPKIFSLISRQWKLRKHKREFDKHFCVVYEEIPLSSCFTINHM